MSKSTHFMIYFWLAGIGMLNLFLFGLMTYSYLSGITSLDCSSGCIKILNGSALILAFNVVFYFGLAGLYLGDD